MMGRPLAMVVAAVLLGTAPPALAAERPSLGAVLDGCTTGPTRADRTATFTGTMPALPGTQRMRMRFDLQRRRQGGRWRRLTGVPGFGRWERSLPLRAGFVFHKRVAGLRAPGRYRAVVRFRWYAADGSLQRSGVRRSRACIQPGWVPDLVPGALTATPAAEPGTLRYALVVRNAGRSASGPFRVRIGPVSIAVPGLQPGERRTVEAIGPACAPGTLVAVLLDADRRVEEAREEDNLTQRLCPPASA